MDYPNINIELVILKIKKRNDEIENLKDPTKKYDHEKILKSIYIDKEYYKKKCRSLNKKKIFVIVSEIMIGSVGLGDGSGLTIPGLAPVGSWYYVC